MKIGEFQQHIWKKFITDIETYNIVDSTSLCDWLSNDKWKSFFIINKNKTSTAIDSQMLSLENI